MPRRRIEPQSRTASPNKTLAERLARELTSGRECGQPFIYEQEYRTGKLRINVIWDVWRGILLPERSATILRGDELAERARVKDRIALTSGLTVLEVHEAGLLPYEVIAAVRKGDPLDLSAAMNALSHEGGSSLFHFLNPRLLLATQEEAEACVKRLLSRFPGSEEVWIVNREIMAEDHVAVNEPAETGK